MVSRATYRLRLDSAACPATCIGHPSQFGSSHSAFEQLPHRPAAHSAQSQAHSFVLATAASLPGTALHRASDLKPRAIAIASGLSSPVIDDANPPETQSSALIQVSASISASTSLALF